MKKKKKVKIPSGTQPYKNGKYTYIYYVVEKVYDKEHQYNNDKRVSIGTKIDDEYMYANDNYYEYFGDEIDPEGEAERSDTLKIGNTMVISKVMEDLDITSILDEIYGNYSRILQDLVSYIIVTEGDAMQFFDSYAFEHPLAGKNLTDDQISEILRLMELKDSELFLRAWNQLHANAKSVYVSYDSTNMNCAAKGIEMADYGHPKIDIGEPVVNVGIASKQDDGTPLFYEDYEGSIVDVSQCRYMVNRCLSYGYKNIGFILDRGYFSKENIDYFDRNGFDFIMMVKGNAKFVQSALEEVKLKLRMDTKCYMAGHYLSGITKEMELYKNDKKKRYLHIFYSDERAASERTKYLERLNKQRNQLDQRIEAKTARKKDLSGYNKYFYLKFDENDYLESYSEKKTEIQKTADGFGYFAILTSEKMTAEEALEKYRSRDYSEKLNTMFKSGLGLNTLRVQSDISAKSKLFIGFLALIVRNEMYQRGKEIAKKERDRKNYTVPAMIHTLDKLFITKDGERYRQMYAATKKQKNILKKFGIDEKYIKSYTAKVNKSLEHK